MLDRAQTSVLPRICSLFELSTRWIAVILGFGVGRIRESEAGSRACNLGLYR
jgi:hypothetical protein